MGRLSFYLYLIFTASWFLHITSRMPVLGAIRIDFILVSIIFILTIIFKKTRNNDNLESSKALFIMILYILITIPFVQWPGSVINNIQEWIKAVIFYYFTVVIINDEKKLKVFIYVFLVVQSIRILEPLYLHITEGYWGSFASMRNWEYMDRLAGAPHDVVNPNGLAFIVLTVMPFFYYLGSNSTIFRGVGIIMFPAMLYVLILTGSRSGLVGLVAIYLSIVYKSKYNKTIIIILGIIAVFAIFMNASVDQKDRYISLFDSSAKNATSTEDRIDGVKKDFDLAMRMPVFGHGLGTSREAIANYTGRYILSHNLYTEILIEIGLFGFLIFLYYIYTIFKTMADAKMQCERQKERNIFIVNMLDSMQVWLFMNIIFSLASYGLSGYEWYLFGGLSASIKRISHTD